MHVMNIIFLLTCEKNTIKESDKNDMLILKIKKIN
jgi:hypothetical protein